ncbi:MAG: hypothetical protein ACO3RV_10300, partial [Luteolibacter sp.]
GQSFAFDVYTSGGGGGDGAVDALSASDTSISNWGDSFTTSEPLIFGSIDPTADDDGDGYTNDEESNGTSALGYQSDPLIPNYTEMNVAGSFNGWSTLDGTMSQGDTASLVEQYQWSYDLLFETAAQTVEYKFTTGGSFDIQWGQGNGAGAVVSSGGNISGFVGASGAYRIFFDQGKSTQSFSRLEFDSLEAYLAAYGLEGDPTGDADGDSLTNEQEFAANTDPLNLDTDDDGASDDIDSLPLVQTRDIEFSVNMAVQEAKGFFTVGSTVQVQFFSGTQEPLSTLTLSDPDEDLVYTATLSAVQGFEGQSFGTYKFITDDPDSPNNGGYEFGFDRSFNLGAAETLQTLEVVFFSGDDQFPQTGFAAWATENAGGGTLDGGL